MSQTRITFTMQPHNWTPNRYKILGDRHDGAGEKLMADDLTKAKAELALQSFVSGAILAGARVSFRQL